MSRQKTKHDDYAVASAQGGMKLTDWLTTVQSEGWIWDGGRPQVLFVDGEPVLRHRFERIWPPISKA
ncbi:hypothetical protein [Kribbella speibonae]|uniref:Uncharacterized protein n=1 Tax=Kribbella speibonae TaxID=1572660 RepID=A0A4R0J3G8_9ACTN|nr:hypothetical protein [Kribbella speibonae]TCC40991.1 hypothetical protein E0H92_04770 [Kribbella speibonae]